MNNFLKPGITMTFTVPAAGVTSGNGYLIGALFVVAANTVAFASGATFEGMTEGMFTLPKTITEGDLVEGRPAFWNVTTGKVSVDPTAGIPIGSIGAAALTADTTCAVRLNGQSLAGRVLHVRKRFTIAQVNAGATLVAAVPGLSARMLDAIGIAIGGAAAAVTTVDIIATVTTARKLVAFAQASLTRSTVLRAGDAGSAVLADGASFTANDVNTAVTVGVTGSAVTTATHIDVLFTYTLE